jgi:hypothetical protein
MASRVYSYRAKLFSTWGFGKYENHIFLGTIKLIQHKLCHRHWQLSMPFNCLWKHINFPFFETREIGDSSCLCFSYRLENNNYHHIEINDHRKYVSKLCPVKFWMQSCKLNIPELFFTNNVLPIEKLKTTTTKH